MTTKISNITGKPRTARDNTPAIFCDGYDEDEDLCGHERYMGNNYVEAFLTVIDDDGKRHDFCCIEHLLSWSFRKTMQKLARLKWKDHNYKDTQEPDY